MIKYQDNAEPSVINYNVPEPTSYRGRNLIRLEFDPTWFNNPVGESYEEESDSDGPGLIATPIIPPISALNPSSLISSRVTGESERATERQPASITLNPSINYTGIVGTNLSVNKIPVITAGVNGTLSEKYATKPKDVDPALYIVETYKLSNFLGDYGAGKVINTFSLLPGEKTTISIKSYKSSSTTTSESSSIFDSYKTEVEESFESSIQSENTDKQTEEDTFNYHVEAEAEASWGWGKAKVSGGVSGSSNSARETFAKNMESSTNKHANKASAQRDITINTSSETTVTEGEEQALERVIENINTDRTLNFVFRQMNQEFISVLHLVDIKIGFYNGFKETKKEVPVADLDELLDEVLKDPDEHKQGVKKEIMGALRNIIDYEGTVHQDFIIKNPDFGFVHVNRSKKTQVVGTDKTVDGLVIMKSTNVLRTDGVIVEALLGQSEAHSPFTTVEKEKNLLLKDASIRSVSLKNDLMDLFINGLKNGDDNLTQGILDYYDKLNSDSES